MPLNPTIPKQTKNKEIGTYNVKVSIALFLGLEFADCIYVMKGKTI